jgi:putative transposase
MLNRRLALDVPRLFVLDGGKALHKAVTDTFGRCAIIQRCQEYKKQTGQFEVLAEFPIMFI